MKTFKQWMEKQFDKTELKDIVNHGVDGGFSGLIYTNECAELFDKYEEIWDLAVEESESAGYGNVLTFIADFRRLDMASDIHMFKNLMVWFAAERYASQLTEEKAVA